ncbi:hypothetical protein O181_100707 [Austropuccinia psidii MF-1]|uniref:Uncharacterized protein n=1 Tax=Austropuccinia psidii MF-1 TaxID=1389203 RepID=A0A9Q3PHS5_9BASI|nr:hypothetical protein [Austropuccinia psidii MF-1]
MRNSNRYKSHSEGSNRHIHEQVKAVLHHVQGQELGSAATNPPRVMSSWHILKRFLKEEEIVRYPNGWNPLLSKPQIKKIKEYHAKKRGASREGAPVASTRKTQVNQPFQEGKKNKKNN